VFPILFEWHGFEVRTYGVIVALALLSAVWVAANEARRRGLAPELVQDFVPYALVAGIVGARLYYVLFSTPGYSASTRLRSSLCGRAASASSDH